MTRRLVLSCEHASNKIPAAYQQLFRGHAALLRSHRGWDAGALDVALHLQRRFAAPLVSASYSRLLVDLNRSPGHPRVFSDISRALPAVSRADLIQAVHQPHWRCVTAAISEARAQQNRRAGPVVHLAVHSFTPTLDGVERSCEIGLLYDPSRRAERTLALDLQRALNAPGRRVRRNYPYRGVADGLPTALRRRFAAQAYAGLELELNQEWLTRVGASVAAGVLGQALSNLGC